jgi:hypothetical protein
MQMARLTHKTVELINGQRGGAISSAPVKKKRQKWESKSRAVHLEKHVDGSKISNFRC